jgi:glycosyltransferase involved in cell wall biosynthesis
VIAVSNEKVLELKSLRSARKLKNKRKVFFWWPDSIFYDVHWKKDPGSIPLELQNLGYDTTLIVGNFFLAQMRQIRTISTRPKVTEEKNFGFIERVVSMLLVLKMVAKERPKAIIIEHAEREVLWFSILLRILMPIHRPSMILKLDVNPDNIKKKRRFRTIYEILLYIRTILFDKTVCESECAYNEYLSMRVIARHKDRLIIIPNGFYTDSNESTIEKIDKGKIILSVGRVAPQKGHDILISIFQKVALKYPDWKLRIVGAIEDKEYLALLLKKIDELKLSKAVIILTDLSDKEIVKEYKKASIFCLLSRWEGFSISRVEAIHWGLPLVISEAGCGKEFKKVGSFVCNIENQECILNALSELMVNDALRLKISEGQKNIALTWEDVALKFSELVESL